MKFLLYERKGLLVNDQASAYLTPQEAKCLTALVRTNGDLVSYDMLYSWLSVEEDSEWDAFIEGYKKPFSVSLWDRNIAENLVHQLVGRVRKKIRATWADCDPYSVIVTHRGRGLSTSSISMGVPQPLTSASYVTLPHLTPRLTPNQEKILKTYSHPTQRNFTERELANFLEMNYSTFRDHRKKLYKEIGAYSKADAVVVAMSMYGERREAYAI